jgi:DNA-binding protein H-NS
MSKLSALKKQIAALEAQAERIAKAEMSSAIAKVKDIMSEFNLTIEHLTQAVGGKRAAKKTKVKTASVAKYADPKTGKTWSGFGRAPGWIADAKNRDEFLVGAVKAAKPAAAKKISTTASAPATKRIKAKVTPATRPAAKKAAAKKKSVVNASTSKTAIKAKTTAKKATPRKASPGAKTPAPVEVAPTAA